MPNETNTLTPAATQLISNVSSAYSAPFWDRVQEVTSTFDTIRKTRLVLETLYSTDNESEAYNLILAVYDLIAIETSSAISELEPCPDAVKQFVTEFWLDIEDLMGDYECEEQENTTT